MLYSKTVSKELYRLLVSIQKDDLFEKLRLVGGTALALQYGHRISVDLDFFGNLNADKSEIVQCLSSMGEALTIKNSKNIKVFTVNGIKVDFVNYNYPWIDKPIEESGLLLASDKDIAAMKVAAITGRGSKKDFVDMYFLLKRFTLSQILEFYEMKYPDASMYLAVKSLTFFEDAEAQPIPKMLQPCEWETVKGEVRNRVREF